MSLPEVLAGDDSGRESQEEGIHKIMVAGIVRMIEPIGRRVVEAVRPDADPPRVAPTPTVMKGAFGRASEATDFIPLTHQTPATDDQSQTTAQGQRKRGASPTHADSKSAKQLWRNVVGEDKRPKGIIQEELETFTLSCGSKEPMSTDSQGLEGRGRLATVPT